MTPAAFLDPAECGWRTALGHDVAKVLAQLDNDARAHRPNPHVGYAIAQCAPIDDDPPISRYRRFVRRMGLWGIEAAGDAIERAGLAPSTRTGVYVGYGGLRPDWDETLPRMEHQRDGVSPWEGGLKDFHPFWMLNHLSNNAHSIVSTKFGLTGDGATYGGTNAGIVALEAAIDALQIGAVDVAVVLAYDTLIQPEVLVEWPDRAETRDLIPGEAAAAVVLRAEPRALRVSAFSDAKARSAAPREIDEVVAALGHVGAAHGLIHLIIAAQRGEPIVFTQQCAPGLYGCIESQF